MHVFWDWAWCAKSQEHDGSATGQAVCGADEAGATQGLGTWSAFRSESGIESHGPRFGRAPGNAASAVCNGLKDSRGTVA